MNNTFAMQEAKKKKEAEELRRSHAELRRKMNKAVFHLLTCAQEAVSTARSFFDGTDSDNDSDSPPCPGGRNCGQRQRSPGHPRRAKRQRGRGNNGSSRSPGRQGSQRAATCPVADIMAEASLRSLRPKPLYAVTSPSYAFMASGAGPSLPHLASSSSTWLIDSGASDHMTSFPMDFEQMTPLVPPRHVSGVDALAEGIGTIRLLVRDAAGRLIPAVMSDVLYVPLLAVRSGVDVCRLFSVPQARRKGRSVLFDPDGDSLHLSSEAGSACVPLAREDGMTWLHATRGADSAQSSAFPSCAADPAYSRLLHSRLGHLSESGMQKLQQAEIPGLKFPSSIKLPFCESCANCKSQVHSISRQPTPRKDEAPFQVVYIDLRGKMSVPSLGGSHWTFGAVCGRTNFLLLQHLRTKDQSSRALRRVLAVIHNFGFRVQKIRIDNDSVFLGEAFQKVCEENLILVERSAPYAHWQLGATVAHTR